MTCARGRGAVLCGPLEGVKADIGKPRWSLLPLGAVRQIIEVLEYGVKKYSEDNWRAVPNAHRRYYDAALRHLTAWWEGEPYDSESGLAHLAHAGCCIMFLLAIPERNTIP